MANVGNKKSGIGGEIFTFAKDAVVFVTKVAVLSFVIWGAGALGWWLGGRYPPPEFLKIIFGG